jgi:hypothetical protein
MISNRDTGLDSLNANLAEHRNTKFPILTNIASLVRKSTALFFSAVTHNDNSSLSGNNLSVNEQNFDPLGLGDNYSIGSNNQSMTSTPEPYDNNFAEFLHMVAVNPNLLENYKRNCPDGAKQLEDLACAILAGKNLINKLPEIIYLEKPRLVRNRSQSY